ncbi:MAG: FAD-dependent oxidoreductase [Lachnospiraceae bacterium]|jgi:glycine/D-amino acid oxidase-like deaminating enzyme|nr:FAD-dependent oxidoreductase [Lachnospiraceae bacterium]RKJ50683.1 FAD-dependent oxidoreductase [bacterium 1XD42-54]
MNSIWKESASLPHFDTLEGSVTTDVLIIGGGIAGILCAYFLREKGVDYVLVEGNTICSGITENTTAKITSQHGLIYDKLLHRVGIEKAKMYLDANQNAVKKYFELCEDIDCDFEKRTNCVYSIDDKRKLEREVAALYKMGFPAEIIETEELPFQTAGAVSFENQAQFHPLKFLAKIAENLNIYEHTFVKELAEHTAVTEKGNIAFQKLIFATHFPIDNKHGMYFLKMYQHRSYVIALENAPKLRNLYVDEAKGGLSFRCYQDILLLGGGAHRTGKRGGNWKELRDFAAEHYPNVREKYFWATQDCMTLDGIPYIGAYSKRMPGCFVATGFHKWGMTSSMAAAMILTDLVLEKENSYAPVFHPSRNMLKPQLLINGWEAAVNLLTISKKRCPHLGCALKWNEAEHSWDCPCHGSRFDEEGILLNNPANGDLRKEAKA